MIKEEIKKTFKNTPQFTTKELVHLLGRLNPEAAEKTHAWKINQMVKEGFINKVGRGIYSFDFKPEYQPSLTLKTKRLYNRIKNLLPLTRLVVWETRMYEELSNKSIDKDFVFVLVSKDEMEPLFNKMMGFSKKVFLNPSHEIIHRYVLPIDEAIIITPLLSEIPLIEDADFITPALEGVLVNFWFRTEEYLEPLGISIEEIYIYAFEHYNVNTSKLLRYASRRDKRSEIEGLINSIVA